MKSKTFSELLYLVAISLSVGGFAILLYVQVREDQRVAEVYETVPDFPIQVVSQHDGGTFTFTRKGSDHTEKLRPRFIDCPEIGQEDGLQALKWSEDYIKGRKLVVRNAHYDAHYGRWVGELLRVTPGNGTEDGVVEHFDEAILRAGWAMLDPRYLTKAASERLDPIQAKAKLSEKGVWKNPNPTPPWQWRETQKAGSLNPLLN